MGPRNVRTRRRPRVRRATRGRPGAALLWLAVAGVALTCDSTPPLPSQAGVADSVVVTPRWEEVHVGDSIQFRAWGISSAGDSLDVPVTWMASGGTVDSTGLFLASASGFYDVEGVYGFHAGSHATVIVRPPDSLLVGVTIEPTQAEVSGGDTVRFATYARYADGPRLPLIPVFAAQGGVMRSDGLFTAGRDPGIFPVVAWDPAGRYHDVALITVHGPPVALVALSPTQASVPAGRTTMLDAALWDADGNVLSGRAVSWTSGAPAIATVLPSAGVVTGVSPGQAQITATSEGVSATAIVTVTGPDAGFWPNEPVGFTLISDNAWDVLSAQSWTVEFGTALIGADPLAPFSPPGVLTITYPAGFVAGSAPGTLTRALPPVRSVYSGLWWKVSNPWQGHDSNVDKIAFIFSQDGGSIVLEMYGPPGGPYQLHVVPQFHGIESLRLPPNVHATPVSLGVWHRLEWLVVPNTSVSPPNGIARWWMDGVLIGDYQNLQFSDQPMGAYKLSPTWGGVGGVPKNELDFYWFDHTRISGR